MSHEDYITVLKHTAKELEADPELHAKVKAFVAKVEREAHK